MAKNLETEEDMKRANSELIDMLRTMAKIKGMKYANAIRVIFAMSNYFVAMQQLCTLLPAHPPEIREGAIVMHHAHATSIGDLIKVLFDSIAERRKDEPEEDYKNRWNDVLADAQRDLKALSDKQNEYGSMVFATPGEFE